MTQPEVWLRGALPDIPALLQPVAHSLLQSREDVDAVLASLPGDLLWVQPGGAASAGFHVRHAAGSLDRLFTYARGESLSNAQRAALVAEKSRLDGTDASERLAREFGIAVDRALDQLRRTDERTLGDRRAVGRGQLPSTVIGLLFHGAEHTQRHIGQLVTTAKVVRAAAGAMP